MNFIKTIFIIPLLAGILFGISQMRIADTSSETAAPALIAVKFHADWCKSCKIMGPAFLDLQNKLDGTSVLFVELDFTNRTTQHQTNLLASALELSDVTAENSGTGFILVFDAESKEVKEKFTKERTVKEMATAIQTHL